MDFVHLSLHSEYSLSDGMVRIAKLMPHLKQHHANAVALTDKGNLFAAVKFYKAAIQAGIKPIFGADCLVYDQDKAYARVYLYAQNQIGYRHLTALLSQGYRWGQQSGSPTLQLSWLLEKHEGLLLLLAPSGTFRATLVQGKTTQLSTYNQLFTIFSNRLYLTLARLGLDDERQYETALFTLAEEKSLPVVAVNDVCFLEDTEFDAHEVRSCIANGWVHNDARRPRQYTAEQYLKSPAEMATLFADCPGVLQNSVEIAKRCNVVLELGNAYLPNFPVPDEMTIEAYFRQQSEEGLKQRLTKHAINTDSHQHYWQRLQTELDVIGQMGFAGYFLIVADFIQWAKAQQIPVGPGRGSGAGSLVAWALQITDLDPLPYDLLFERFLNPERVSMPDFDIDFCMEGRDRVIEYVAHKYGREAVSQIATHGTMAAKAVVRDVGRALGHPYGFVDRIARLIPFELGMTLEKALAQQPELSQLYENDDEVRILLDYAKALEGLTRSVGRHAGGVVIAPTQLTDFSPLYCEQDSEALVTQFDKDDIEAVGLVKFDFLGLRTLTIIDWALHNITRRHQKSIDILDIPLDDTATFDLLKRCQTTAVFQLESRGMKDLVRRLQPDTFEDIIALVALFRPGPLESGMVDDFINRKHGRASVEYPFAELEAVLKPTYGVIVYQEQVMQISQIIGNYTLGGADLLRRAMGKKKPEEMAQQRAIFLEGAQTLGFDEKRAGELFDLMEKFAGYGFNKSHSAAYALVAYQTAYLKAHYPAEFMAAVLSSDMDKTEKVVVFIDECREMQLTVLPPNINHSDYHFSVTPSGEILYGLGAVKGVGEAVVTQLVEERQRNGLYKDLFDFCARLDHAKMTKRVIEILIRAGALDCFLTTEHNMLSLCQLRADMMLNLPEALSFAEYQSQNAKQGQVDLFGFETPVAAPSVQRGHGWSEKFLLDAEKEVLGFYLTAHPIDRYRRELKKFVTHTLLNIAEIEPTSAPAYLQRKQEPNALIAGIITKLRTKISQSGQKMTFITLDDHLATLEVRVFDDHLSGLTQPLAVDDLLVIKGVTYFDDFNNRGNIRVHSLLTLDEIRQQMVKAILLTLQAPHLTAVDMDTLQINLQQLNEKTGRKVGILCRYQRPQLSALLKISTRYQVPVTEESLSVLQQLSTHIDAQYIYQQESVE